MTGSLSANLTFIMPPDPIHNQSYQDLASSIKPENDPETSPPKGPGDSFLLAFTLLGLVLGGLLGYVLAFFLIDPHAAFLSAIICGLGSAIAGFFVGDAIRKRKVRRLQHNRVR